MSNNIKSSSISDNDLQEITRDEILQHIDKIARYSVPVWRKNIENALVTIPLPKLKQYIGDKSSEEYILYIEKNWEAIVESNKQKSKTELMEQPQAIDMKEMKQYRDVDKQVERFRQLSIVEREEI